MFHEAERRPPEHDVQRALEHLMTGLARRRRSRAPARARPARRSPTTSTLPGYCAWYAAARRPGDGAAAGRLGADRRPRPERSEADVPEARADELLAIAAAELIEPKTLDGYFEALERLSAAAGDPGFDQALARALSDALAEQARTRASCSR